jgi:hypothetical protein
MSIILYPTRIEAVDEAGQAMFHLESFDEHTCSLKFDGLIGPDNLTEVLDAIRAGVEMLDLKGDDDA